MIAVVPDDYKADNFFSIVFFEVAGKSPNALETLQELGLDERHMVANGMYAFENRWPANDTQWKIATYRRSGYGMLILYYAHHPGRAWSILKASMKEYGRDIRPVLLSNFRKQDGFALGSRSMAFALSSDMKSWAYRQSISWVFILYGVSLALGAGLLTRDRQTGSWVLMVVAIGLGELLISTLCDAVETSRHLLLFHCITDVLICAVLAGLCAAARRLHLTTARAKSYLANLR